MNAKINYLKKDSILKKIIDVVDDELTLHKSEKYFDDIVSTIIYQQLSSKAAKSIYERFLALFPNNQISPEKLLALSEEELLSVGLSRQKRSYLYSLATKFLDGTITTDNFHNMSDEEIIKELIQIKGIGRWSAQMFLMFTLAREDVFAPDDLGLRKAIQINYKFDSLPTPKEAEKIAEKWRPYRSYASLLLWRSLDNSKI